MKVLAIESTCDETAAAVVENFKDGARVLQNIVASSVEMHQKYGGIVPEVAAREQIKSIIPVILEAMTGEEIEAIAVSYGPGLMGSLLIGVETAKALAWAWKKPLLRVNHMTAHVMANWIVDEDCHVWSEIATARSTEIRNDAGAMTEGKVPELPAIGLVVSGGHTDLILLESLSKWTWIGGTRDDAVGEAFDKTARLLGLPYPGGPEVDKAASKVTDEEWKLNKDTFKLPRPLIHNSNLEMSFSGIKAAVARIVQSEEYTSWIPGQTRNDSGAELKTNLAAREFSEAVTEVLVKKTMMAVEKYAPKSVILAGGVAANKKLRETLRNEVEKLSEVKFFVPELKYCGDNAAMVGAAAILRPESTDLNLRPDPSLGVV